MCFRRMDTSMACARFEASSLLLEASAEKYSRTGRSANPVDNRLESFQSTPATLEPARSRTPRDSTLSHSAFRPPVDRRRRSKSTTARCHSPASPPAESIAFRRPARRAAPLRGRCPRGLRCTTPSSTGTRGGWASASGAERGGSASAALFCRPHVGQIQSRRSWGRARNWEFLRTGLVLTCLQPSGIKFFSAKIPMRVPTHSTRHPPLT